MSYYYDEFEEYEEDTEYNEYHEYYPYDESNADDWVDEWEVSAPLGGGFSSLAISGFVPMIAVGVSIGMVLMFLRFVTSQMPEIEFPVSALQTRAETNVLGLTGSIAPLFTPSVQYWKADILRWAGEWGLDPNLVATVMQIESCGNPDVTSSAGATGLFQVMPFHFQTAENPYDPNTNAYRGMSYLSRSLANFDGNVKMALAGYNAGIGGASKGEAYWPAETVRYTTWGVGIYEDARTGKSESVTLNEWFSRASGMCNNAAKRLGITP
jgi:hypothetical protein